MEEDKMDYEGSESSDGGEETSAETIGEWKTEHYREDGKTVEFTKKVVSAGKAWRRPKLNEKAFVDLHWKPNEASEPSASIKEHAFTLSLEEEQQELTACVQSMKSEEVAEYKLKKTTTLAKLFPGAAELDESILNVHLVRFNQLELAGPEGKEKAVRVTLYDVIDSWKQPKEGATVKVDVTGSANGQVFVEKKEVTWVLGDEYLASWICDGLNMGLEKLKAGQSALVEIDPEFAYQSLGHDLGTLELEKQDGVNGIVSQSSPVSFEVKLIEFEDVKASWELDDDGKITAADENKTRGNLLFKENRIAKALKRYQRAVRYVDYMKSEASDPEEKKTKAKQGQDLCKAIRLNISACQIKLGMFKEAKEELDKILKDDPANTKARFRLAQCLMGMDRHREALVVLSKLKVDVPTDAAVASAMNVCNKVVTEEDAQAKSVFAKMFA